MQRVAAWRNPHGHGRCACVPRGVGATALGTAHPRSPTAWRAATAPASGHGKQRRKGRRGRDRSWGPWVCAGGSFRRKATRRHAFQASDHGRRAHMAAWVGGDGDRRGVLPCRRGSGKASYPRTRNGKPRPRRGPGRVRVRRGARSLSHR